MTSSSRAKDVDPTSGDAGLTVTLTRKQLLGLLTGQRPDGIAMDGDTGVLRTVLSLLDQPDPNFTIVTP